MEKNYRAELTGVFGDPVDANPTGVMEEAGFRAKGLNFRYITARVLPESLGAAVAGARAMHMKGFNLTMPHKVRVIPFLDGVTEAARIIGAVNTVYEENGNYIGENTDGKGFVEALKMQGESAKGKRVVLLGAGGAGKAIGVECALAGARHIAVVNRNRERGEELVKTIRENTACAADYIPWQGCCAIPECDVLVNATCVGLAPLDGQKPDIDYACMRPGMVVCDVVFSPEWPPFLLEARARGAKAITGLGMLACQGARNFTLWTGQQAPFEVMFEALKREFEEDPA